MTLLIASLGLIGAVSGFTSGYLFYGYRQSLLLKNILKSYKALGYEVLDEINPHTQARTIKISEKPEQEPLHLNKVLH